MAKSSSLMLPQNANTQSVTILPADTTVQKLCFTAGANDSDVKAILVTSNDTATMNVTLYVTRSAVDYLLGTVRVVTLSGTDGAAVGIDLLNSVAFAGLPLDAIGKRYLPLKTGDTLKVGVLVTVTTAKTVTVNVFGQDY